MDTTITDIYIGHTTNFTNRKRHHKTTCNNENIKGYNYYVYQFIRNNGGWDNWSMVEIEKISCIDSTDACKNERRYIELLGATLNKKAPYITQIEHIEYKKNKNKEYYECNKDKKKEYLKEYYDSNKDKKKEYYECNKDKIKERRKEYYEQHKK